MVETLSSLFPHSAITGDITVRVAVSYLAEQSAPEQGRWFWSYHVRIENHGSASVQLLGRHWRILDGLALSGHFLVRDVLTDRSSPVTEARVRLVERMKRAAGTS